MAYPNTEALPVTNYSLEIYTFFTIDIKKGSIAHFVMYNFDRINLTHGVALCGTTMMIMSLQKQIIHMLHVDEFGAMIPLKDIGASIWDDDGLYLFGDCQATPTRTSLYTGLKQRLLTFLYKEAKREGNVEEFLRLTPSYVEKLRMHRAQLFDGHYLLVRMLPHTSIRYDIALMPCFLFILDWRDCKILAVYQEYGPELLAFYENFVEVLLTPTQNPHRYPKSFQYNPHSKQKAHWLMGNSSGSEFFERMYEERLSGAEPFCGCHHSSSENPYLDPLYFSIDEKISFESDVWHAHQIFARRTQHHVCSLSLPPSLASKSPACVILFHPQDPLAIAFDRIRTDQPTMRTTAAVREMHVALVGMTGSGKSAIAVKYITKRFIGEYDSSLEDTYCRQDTVAGQPLMVWMMDTVDDASRDEMRWLAWADVYLVVYDVTSMQKTFSSASPSMSIYCVLENIRRFYWVTRTIWSDIGKYLKRQGEADWTRQLKSFCESEQLRDHAHGANYLILQYSNWKRSPSPRLCSSDSEIVTPRKSAFSALRSTSRSGQVRSKAAKPVQLHKTPSLSKIKTGSKLLKLFHN
ncbi:hypothetical protein OSTOST_11965 [Ostertagia ostertagi]